MTDANLTSDQTESRSSGGRSRSSRRRFKHRLFVAAVWTASSVTLLGAAGLWLGAKASIISSELDSAAKLIPELKAVATGKNPQEATLSTLDQLRAHTAAAREAAEDPIWSLAAAIPVVGANFSAISEVARSADDVSTLAVAPLVNVVESLKWDSLLPNTSGADLEPLRAASPSVSSAAHAVRLSADRLNRIDESQLLPQVAQPLSRAREQLQDVTGALDSAASASEVLPGMLGIDGPRKYLVVIQNNAEARASGGIPGALAVLTLDDGKLSLGAQSSASQLGVMSPAIPVEPEQQAIYSGRLGKFMQDVNLTPDFPTAASTAQIMWESETGERVDGVLSIDPVALGYILDATGPVSLTYSEGGQLARDGLPTELTGKNVVKTLLSDVYSKIEHPVHQDAYFAAVAQQIFATLADGQSDAAALIKGVTRGTEEGRVLVWSGSKVEQAVIAKYPLSGAVSGPSVAPAQFGVYFNDGTGAKMDYYVHRTVQLVKECAKDGYEQTTVRVTSTNRAPADAGESLPAYVTGGGIYGIPPGSVQTNVVAYGPVQSNIETAKVDGERNEFAPYLHRNRPVGVLAVQLAPGETKSVDFTFGKIVQHAEPNLVVTPTVQDVKDVIMPTQIAQCG